MKKLCCWLLVIAGLVMSQTKVMASFEALNTGDTITTDSVTPFPSGAVPSGTVLADITATVSGYPGSPPSLTANYTARVEEVVLEVGNHLDFLFQISNDISSTHSLGRLTLNGFAGAGITGVGVSDGTNASYSTGTSAPSEADRNSDSFGDEVGFNFGGTTYTGSTKIAPGSSSKWLVIETSNTAYAPTNGAVIDGATAQFDDYGPANGPLGSLVPVPPSWVFVLTALPLLGLWVMVRRIVSVRARLAS